MEVEWQTLLKNQAAMVLSLEETAQALARWPDAMDTRWARTGKPDDKKPPGRRAKARLIIEGFTDPDLLDIESHSPTLTREGFMTVLQSVCSHGHKLQFGDVQQAFNSGDPIKREHLRQNAARWSPRWASWRLGEVAQDSQWTGRWHEGREELFPCYNQRSGFWDVCLGTMCFSAEGLTTKIPWSHGSGRRRHCWWRRWSLGTSNSYKQQMDPCALDSLLISRVWTLCPSEKWGRNDREMQTKLKKLPWDQCSKLLGI